MNNIIFKTTLIKGAQGAKGDPGEGDSIPTQSVIAYEGEEIPEGYIRTDAPAEFQNLETRLNNIIAHPVDEETTAEELVDVRVSAYGDTYESAGDAVRGQVDILQEQIDRLLDNTIQGSGEGEIVSYENGSDILPMKSAKVYINPKQDLHGQSAPYVGGAGKNKLPLTVSGIKAANTGGTWTGNVYTINGVSFTILTDNGGNVTGINVNGTASADVSFTIGKAVSSGATYTFNGCPSGGSTNTYYANVTYMGNDIGQGNFNKTIEQGNLLIYSIKIKASATVANQIFYPMIILSTSTTTFEQYSNICPISGYEGVGLDISNSNLWDETVLEGLWHNGERLEVANRICSNYIYVKGLNGEGQTPNGVRWVSSQDTPDFSAYDENKNYLYGLPYTEDTDGIWVPIPEAAYYVTFNFNNSYGGTYLNDTALLRPITKTEYVAHEGKEYNVQIKNRNLLQLTLENIMNLNSDWDWTLEDGVLTCDKGDDAYKWEIYFKSNGLIRIHAIAQGTAGYDELFLPIPEGGYPSGTYYAKYTGGSDLLKVYIDVGQNIIVDEYEIIENQIRAASVVVSGLDSLLDDVCICKDREDLNLPIYIKGAPDDVTYGGWVDIATGELVVNMGEIDFTTYTGTINKTTVPNAFYTQGLVSMIKKPLADTRAVNMKCEALRTVSYTFLATNSADGLIACGTSGNVWIKCLGAGDSVDTLKSMLSDVKLVFELADPITYQLTKQEVLAILGANNVYSKDGSVAVIYRQDTNLVIQDILNRLGA